MIVLAIDKPADPQPIRLSSLVSVPIHSHKSVMTAKATKMTSTMYSGRPRVVLDAASMLYQMVSVPLPVVFVVVSVAFVVTLEAKSMKSARPATLVTLVLSKQAAGQDGEGLRLEGECSGVASRKGGSGQSQLKSNEGDARESYCLTFEDEV